MNNVKRSFISIARQPVKSSILLCLLFITNLLVIGSISVHMAINRTEENMLRRIPAVSLLEQTGDIRDEENWPTHELINEIGQLPQVHMFDYYLKFSQRIHAYGLIPWSPPHFYTPLEMNSYYHPEFGAEFESVVGIGNVDFLEIRSDFLELSAGRVFTENELIEVVDVFPILVSTGFAEVNALDVGSIFEIIVSNWNWFTGLGEVVEGQRLQEKFSVEIIGIYEPYVPLWHGTTHFFVEVIAQSRVYIPIVLAEMMLEVRAGEGAIEKYGESMSRHMFLLHDSRLFDEFSEAVTQITDDFVASDFSRGFGNIRVALESLREVTDSFLMISVGAMFVVIFLGMSLFLYDRRHEIGIYLSLGEKRKSILIQIIVEVVPLSLIAMTIALFVGNALADQMSQEMLRQELAGTSRINEWNVLEQMGYRFELTDDETLAMFEVRLDTATILVFYASGLSVVALATSFPIIMVVKMNPKKVLL